MNNILNFLFILLPYIVNCQVENDKNTDCKYCQNALSILKAKYKYSGKEKDSLTYIIEQLKEANLRVNYDDFTSQLRSIEREKQVMDTKLNSLENENENLTYKLNNANKEIRQNKSHIYKLEQDARNNEVVINELKVNIGVKQDEIDYLQSVLNCIKEFNYNKEKIIKNSNQKISEAREKYDLLREKRKLGKLQKDLETEIAEIVKKYEDFKQNKFEDTCYGIVLNFVSDNMKAIDHYNIAVIYGYNQGRAINNLEKTNQISKASNIFLSNLGSALEKGLYNDKSLSNALLADFNDIMDHLDFHVIIDRKENVDNSETNSAFNNIINLFNAKEFVSALSLYNKYKKLATLEKVMEKESLMRKVEYCVGVILLWNLAQIDNNKDLFIRGSWLGDIKDYPTMEGRSMLQSLIRDDKTEIELKRKCFIALNKV